MRLYVIELQVVLAPCVSGFGDFGPKKTNRWNPFFQAKNAYPGSSILPPSGAWRAPSRRRPCPCLASRLRRERVMMESRGCSLL